MTRGRTLQISTGFPCAVCEALTMFYWFRGLLASVPIYNIPLRFLPLEPISVADWGEGKTNLFFEGGSSQSSFWLGFTNTLLPLFYFPNISIYRRSRSEEPTTDFDCFILLEEFSAWVQSRSQRNIEGAAKAGGYIPWIFRANEIVSKPKIHRRGKISRSQLSALWLFFW